MKALTDQAHRGLLPESALKVYEFGNGRVQKRDGKGAYDGLTYNKATGLFE